MVIVFSSHHHIITSWVCSYGERFSDGGNCWRWPCCAVAQIHRRGSGTQEDGQRQELEHQMAFFKGAGKSERTWTTWYPSSLRWRCLMLSLPRSRRLLVLNLRWPSMHSAILSACVCRFDTIANDKKHTVRYHTQPTIDRWKALDNLIPMHL